MQQAGARRAREDDYEYTEPTPARRLQLVDETASAGPRTEEAWEPVYAENGRRTVTITGHPLPPRRRPSPTQSQIQARPDRIALWAFLLGLFLVFMAVATANAAVI